MNSNEKNLIDINNNNETLLSLSNYLKKFNFSNLETYPWPGELRNLYNDIFIFFRFLINKSNCWQQSCIWRIYLQILKIYNYKLSILAITFMWCKPIEKNKLNKVLGVKVCKHYLEKKIIIEKNNYYLSRIRITPFNNQIIFSDAPPLFVKNVVFIGPDSLTFIKNLDLLIKNEKLKYNNALDICTGSGIHAFHLKKYANRIIGSDINNRAISYANFNNKININNHKIKFINSDLYSNISSIKFDLVVANTPFLFLPKELREHCVDGDGGFMGIEFVVKLIKKTSQNINSTGRAIFYSNSPIINNKKDLLKDELIKFQKTNSCKISLKEIHAYYNPNFFELYNHHNISYFVSYIIDIKFSEDNEILIEKMPLLRNFLCKLRIIYQKTRILRKFNINIR